MSEEELVNPPRYSGRTYSRRRTGEDAAGSKPVPVKAAMSLSKWGNTKIVPFRDGADGASETKRAKVESRGEDPFSFDTEDKRKLSPVKKQDPEPQPSDSRYATKLPASRINVNDPGVKREAETIRTYGRTTPKKPVAMEPITDRKLSSSGQASLVKPMKPAGKEEDSDDDIFPVQFKREPLKTYSGDVVTPVDKPDSPPPARKSGYKKKGGPRGRKPLTVSDPGLIEEYRKNYAAQQLINKPDTSTGGLNNSMVVSKQEVANSDQGTTLVVVCKPKAQIEKTTEVSAKYFQKTKGKNSLTQVVSDATSPQTSQSSKNGDSSQECTTSVTTGTPPRTSARLRSGGASDSSVERLHTPGSAASTGSSMSASARLTRGRVSLNSSQSADSGSQGDSGQTNKRYRIFKSRTPQVVQQPDAKSPALEEVDEESPIPETLMSANSSSVQLAQQNLQGEWDTQETSVKEDNTQSQSDEIMDHTQTSTASEVEQASEGTEPYAGFMETGEDTPMQMSQDSASSEPAPTAVDIETGAVKAVNPSAARELLAARLRNKEKQDSDSNGEQDNMSECSEGPPQSQDSVSSSQKEGSVEAPRRFFKSKKSLSGSSDLQRKIFSNSPQKSPAKATYNARSWFSENEAESQELGGSEKRQPGKDQEDIVLVKGTEKGPKLKREVHWPERKFDEAYTSLKVNKTHKELYTVVHNVKQTHEVQELGETQDFIDDVNYLLESLRDTNSTSIRCLSCLKLAGKCISPAFRMHMRAHGTVSKIFSLLHDARSDPSLALSTSAIMFMLSRDRLNMDLDQESLELMLRLNEVDQAADIAPAKRRELEKTVTRVQGLLGELQQELHAKEIDLGFVSTGNLAMESLLSLTSRRAGEWFKEELRSVGGLGHIVQSVKTCEESLPLDLNTELQKSLPVLRKLDRCLRVLENLSFQNSDNQSYMVSFKDGALLKSCARTLSLCQACMVHHKILEDPEEVKEVKELPGYTVLTCMLATLRVLLNVTHEHKSGKLDIVAESFLMESILLCLTSTQWCVPIERRFDLAVLCLGLLINLVENSKQNRQTMMETATQVKVAEKAPVRTMTAVHAIVEIFVEREATAHEMEEDTAVAAPADNSSPNKSGEWRESDSGIQWITNSLQQAKDSVVGSQDSSVNLSVTDGGTQGEGEGNQSILEDDEETFTKALHKAGKHMENSIVASYAGLLLGTIIMDNKENAATVKELIPNGDFVPMIKILKKFLNFMSLTTAFGSTDVNGITKVIEVLQAV